ncbi:MAG: ComEC family competence protein, partial [Ottowia sp.]|nr:ComEC family competence protein [Ottowia sp.]
MHSPATSPTPSPAAHCLVAALLGWVAGTGAQVLQPALWPAWMYALLLVGVLAALFVLRRWRFPALWLLCAALAAFSCTGFRAAQRVQLAPQLDGQALTLTGVVAALPQRTASGWRFLFEVEEAQHAGMPPRVLLTWRAPDCLMPEAQKPCTPAQAAWPAQLRAGERWRLEARVQRPHGQLNPHGFDWELWLWARGIAATGSVRMNAAPPALLDAAAGVPLLRLRQHMYGRIKAALADGDARAAGIVAALALGEQSAVARADWGVFRRTGTAHLMVVSGLHITLLAWLAYLLTERLWRFSARLRLPLCDWASAPTAARLGALAAAALYAALSGWGVPAQRTLLMLAAALLPHFCGLRLPWALTLLLACAAVLAFDPWALTQPGFWLSFAAVGVLLAAGFRDAPAASVRHAALGYARRLLGAQARLTLALAPLTLLLFGQASLMALAANIVAIPWVTLLAVPLALAGLLCAPLWKVAAALLAPLLATLDWLAAWPQAAFTLPAAPWPLAVLAVAGALLAAIRLPLAMRLA